MTAHPAMLAARRHWCQLAHARVAAASDKTAKKKKRDAAAGITRQWEPRQQQQQRSVSGVDEALLLIHQSATGLLRNVTVDV